MANHDYETHLRQIVELLTGLGMEEEDARRTAEILAWADMRGIESHGIAMVPEYAGRVFAGRTNPRAKPHVLKETPVSALIDGDGGLGHVPAHKGTTLAMEKARQSGVGIVSIRNSGHFGALGYYTSLAADAGLIAMMTTSVSGIKAPPAGGAVARLGTDPWSFAAPGAEGLPFVLDMATTTVASGRVRNKYVEGLPIPHGWALDSSGQPTTNPADVVTGGGFLTPLGGTVETASYKGYGLAVMVNILASALSDSTLITDPMHTRQPKGMDTAHFILVFDPGLFGPVPEFRERVATLCDAMRSTPPVDPDKPVMVAGDPERKIFEERRARGLSIPPKLTARLHDLARQTGAAWLLDAPGPQAA